MDVSGSTTSYTYDANGNLTSDGTKTYFWNALNQLVEVKEGSTTIATFEYDGNGRRTEKFAAGLTHAYIYDVEDIVEERISGIELGHDPLLPRRAVSMSRWRARTAATSSPTTWPII